MIKYVKIKQGLKSYSLYIVHYIKKIRYMFILTILCTVKENSNYVYKCTDSLPGSIGIPSSGNQYDESFEAELSLSPVHNKFQLILYIHINYMASRTTSKNICPE